MEIFSTIISLVDLYCKVSGILKGHSSKQVLDRIAIGIERLSDNIFFAPNIHVIQQLNQQPQRYITDLREVRQYLEPIQQVVGGQILSSSMIVSPDKLQVAFKRNPWEVLDYIRPANLATPHSNPDMVPVLFSHSNTQFIGWQLRGALPILLDCKYEDIWTPTDNTLKQSVLTDNDNGLFPLYNVSLGETTISELKKMGQKDKKYRCYEINGLDFWYDENSIVANSMYLWEFRDKLPEKWVTMGFNWQLSFDEWWALFQKLGYEITVSKAPKVVLHNFNGRIFKSFDAGITAIKREKRSIKLELNFSYSEKTTSADRGTLYKISVRSISE